MFLGHPMAIVVYICLVIIVAYIGVAINWYEGRYKKGRK